MIEYRIQANHVSQSVKRLVDVLELSLLIEFLFSKNNNSIQFFLITFHDDLFLKRFTFECFYYVIIESKGNTKRSSKDDKMFQMKRFALIVKINFNESYS